MLIILTLGSRLGLWIMSSKYFFLMTLHDLANNLLDYTINMIQSILHAVHCPLFMHCYILPQLLGQWVLSGLIGPFQWNGIVEKLDITLRADSFPMQLSTSILPPKHSLPMSPSFMGSMTNFLSVPLNLMIKIFSYLYVSLANS